MDMFTVDGQVWNELKVLVLDENSQLSSDSLTG
jgi:hypothetical protein